MTKENFRIYRAEKRKLRHSRKPEIKQRLKDSFLFLYWLENETAFIPPAPKGTKLVIQPSCGLLYYVGVIGEAEQFLKQIKYFTGWDGEIHQESDSFCFFLIEKEIFEDYVKSCFETVSPGHAKEKSIEFVNKLPREVFVKTIKAGFLNPHNRGEIEGDLSAENSLGYRLTSL